MEPLAKFIRSSLTFSNLRKCTSKFYKKLLKSLRSIYLTFYGHWGLTIEKRFAEWKLKTQPKQTLPPSANFTNILWADFCTKVFCAPFMCLQFGFVIFWRKDLGAKAANNLLVKLPPSGNSWRRNSTSC